MRLQTLTKTCPYIFISALQYCNTVSIVVLILLMLFASCPRAWSQAPPANPPADSAAGGGEAASRYDEEVLGKLTPEKMEALDRRLAEALTLYYDGQYGKALPIFNEISRKVETMDIMWWVGTSAMKTGDLNTAVSKFRKMLAIDPKLSRVRLDLAAACFELGRYTEARKELETVKESKPPAEVMANIEKMLAAIDERTRKVFANVRFSQGIQWDTNASSGPDQKDLSVVGGTLSLSPTNQKVRDWASITNAEANVLYDIGERQGLMWNTTANLYKSVYFSNGQFNFTLTDVTTGPWWAGRQDIVKLPIGYTEQEYGSDRLSYIYHVDPSYEHYFNPYFSLRGSFTWSKETFYDQNKNGALDNDTRRYEISPNIYLDNRRHIFSFYVGYESYDAEQRRWTYSAPYFALSYFTRFPTKTDLFLKYQWGEKDYKDAPLLYTDSRVDRRSTYTAVVSQEIIKHLFASFVFNYIDNNSNTELYDFDKATYTLNVGFYF